MLALKKYFLITILFSVFLFPLIIFASTGTISSTYKYAWSENGGWTNFACQSCSVQVGDSEITGYAWNQNYGWIKLNPAQSGVKNNGSGTLSGKAWGENVGWIDFSGVTIDSNGQFQGQTQSNSILGSINFTYSNNCQNCKVVTTWRQATTSSVGGSGSMLSLLNQSQSQSSQTPFSQMTNDQKIAYLTSQIASLTSQLQAMQQSQNTNTTTFTRNLKLGDTGNDVKALQQYLNTHGFTVATTGPGSPGHETTIFGYATKQALIKFQEAHADQILKPYYTKGTGVFGVRTRGWVNENL